MRRGAFALSTESVIDTTNDKLEPHNLETFQWEVDEQVELSFPLSVILF